jgi:hypothetical protein
VIGWPPQQAGGQGSRANALAPAHAGVSLTGARKAARSPWWGQKIHLKKCYGMWRGFSQSAEMRAYERYCGK